MILLTGKKSNGYGYPCVVHLNDLPLLFLCSWRTALLFLSKRSFFVYIIANRLLLNHSPSQWFSAYNKKIPNPKVRNSWWTIQDSNWRAQAAARPCVRGLSARKARSNRGHKFETDLSCKKKQPPLWVTVLFGGRYKTRIRRPIY